MGSAMIIKNLIVCFLLTAHFLSFQEPSRPFYQEMSWSPDSSGILFSGFHSKQADIYVMNADGSGLKQLTDHPSADMWGSFSPDGKRIVFQSKRDGAQEDIYIMNADGSNVVRLTNDPARDIGPSWSPDGKRIAFSSSRDGGLQLYLMNVDGSNQTRLTRVTDGKIKYYNPVWSPNGKRLVFYSETGDRKDQVQIINANGTGQTVLTGGIGNNIFPSWSPDGRRVIFSSNRDGVDGAIYEVKVDGSQLRRIAGEVKGFVVRWAPNGKKIGFVAGSYPASDIYVMNPDGSNVVKLTK